MLKDRPRKKKGDGGGRGGSGGEALLRWMWSLNSFGGLADALRRETRVKWLPLWDSAFLLQ